MPAPANLRGYFASAAGMDGGFFLIMTAMPFKVLALGGSSLHLGAIAAVGAVAYILSAPIAGRLSDHVPRRKLAHGGAVALVLCAVAAWLVPRLDLLIALQVLMGMGKAFYWPPVQATIGDLTPAHLHGRMLGQFNLSWSGGKTLGFVLGGLLLTWSGFQATYLTGAACVLAAAVILPRDRREQPTAGESAPTSTGPPQPPALLWMSWLANTAAYGAFGILTYHLPRWFEHRGWQADLYGWYLGAILASQTVLFWAVARWAATTGRPVRWTERRLWWPQVVHLVALAVLPLAGGFGWLVVTAPLVGLGCGIAYQASITASLIEPETRGQRAGIHEGLIGAGGFVPPLLAGFLVDQGLGLAAPYWLAAGLVAASLTAQIAVRQRAVTRS